MSRRAFGRVVGRRTVGFDVVTQVVVGVPAPRRRQGDAGPRGCVNSFFARARPEAPRLLAGLDRQHHGVTSHLDCRQSSKDQDRHAASSESVVRCIDHVLHAVDRCHRRGKARTLAASAETAVDSVLRKYGVDDGNGSSGRESRIGRLKAKSRSGRILIGGEHPRGAVRPDYGQCLRRGGDFVSARLSAARRDESDASQADDAGSQSAYATALSG